MRLCAFIIIYIKGSISALRSTLLFITNIYVYNICNDNDIRARVQINLGFIYRLCAGIGVPIKCARGMYVPTTKRAMTTPTRAFTPTHVSLHRLNAHGIAAHVYKVQRRKSQRGRMQENNKKKKKFIYTQKNKMIKNLQRELECARKFRRFDYHIDLSSSSSSSSFHRRFYLSGHVTNVHTNSPIFHRLFLHINIKSTIKIKFINVCNQFKYKVQKKNNFIIYHLAFNYFFFLFIFILNGLNKKKKKELKILQ